MNDKHDTKNKAASKRRDNSIQQYYDNPNKCLHCGNVIDVPDGVKVSAVKKKKFCNKSCNVKYNDNKTVTKMCRCGNLILANEKECETCKQKRRIHTKTKNDLFEDSGSWQTVGSAIRKDANVVFDQHAKLRVCATCGYNKHAEICHVKPVSDFPKNALIDEINSPDNLVALCPNCHWEFDNDPNAVEIRKKIKALAKSSQYQVS